MDFLKTKNAYWQAVTNVTTQHDANKGTGNNEREWLTCLRSCLGLIGVSHTVLIQILTNKLAYHL